MTRKEAIGNLNMIRVAFIDTVTVEQGMLIDETFITAIKALKQEPCEDAISRSDMLDAIGHGTTYTSEGLQRIIKGMPPVKPQEPKTGHWITKPHIYGVAFCSECDELRIDKTKFCPNCGAKMIEPQESEG